MNATKCSYEAVNYSCIHYYIHKSLLKGAVLQTPPEMLHANLLSYLDKI